MKISGLRKHIGILKGSVLFSFVSIYLLFFSPLLFAQGTEDINITTYYPSPQGIYNTVKLEPTTRPRPIAPVTNPPICNEGELYYDDGSGSEERGLYFCKGDDWGRLGGGVPSGTVMFFNLTSCPTDWSWANGGSLGDTRGRYLVGRPSGGTLRGTAGTALADAANPAVSSHTHTGPNTGSTSFSHTHTFNAWPDGGGITGSPYFSIMVPSGSWVGNWMDLRTHTHGGIVTGDIDGGATSGTNAPYIELLVCVKD